MSRIQFIAGNHPEHTMWILNELDINKKKIVLLEDYVPEEKVIPIMVSSHGIYHGDSGRLTEKLENVKLKAVYDWHNDFRRNPAKYSPNPLFPDLLSSCLINMGLDIYDPSRKDSLNYASHVFHTWKSGIDILLLGIDETGKKSVLDDLKRFRQKPERLYFSDDLIIPEWLQGKNIHLSIDTDVILDAPYVEEKFKRNNSGPDLKKVTKSLSRLISKNNLIAFDICGYYPRNTNDPELTDVKGLVAYDTLISTVINSLNYDNL